MGNLAYTHKNGKGQMYTLYERAVTLKNGTKQTIYFFAKGTPKSGNQCNLPDKYMVGENSRTGLPYLKKK